MVHIYNAQIIQNISTGHKFPQTPFRGLGNTREIDTIKTWLTLREVVEGFISMSSTIGLRRSAILIALIFLIADCSSAASSLTDENDGHQANTFPVTHVEPILVEGLSLIHI